MQTHEYQEAVETAVSAIENLIKVLEKHEDPLLLHNAKVALEILQGSDAVTEKMTVKEQLEILLNAFSIIGLAAKAPEFIQELANWIAS